LPRSRAFRSSPAPGRCLGGAPAAALGQGAGQETTSDAILDGNTGPFAGRTAAAHAGDRLYERILWLLRRLDEQQRRFLPEMGEDAAAVAFAAKPPATPRS